MENSFPIEQGLPFQFTDKPATPWGGLRLVQEMLLRMKFRDALRASGLPQPRSNRGYDPAVMMEAFLVCVWIGGVRFSHTSVVRFDEALRQIFGWKRVASVSTYTRWFRRFKREEVDQVFGNLLGNAFKFTPPGGAVTLKLTTAPDGWATIQVEDTGPGIPAQDLPRLFERFYRGEQDNGSLPGTGLGLALAKECVELHGGEIRAENRLGGGACFTVRLKTVARPSPGQDAPTGSADAAQP